MQTSRNGIHMLCPIQAHMHIDILQVSKQNSIIYCAKKKKNVYWCWIDMLSQFMMRNPSKIRPLRVTTHVRQTSDPCKAPPPHRSGNTTASPVNWSQRIVWTQGDSNFRPHGTTTKTKTLTTWANPLGLPHRLVMLFSFFFCFIKNK
jgi:hypothetical protein